ncbi:hypothetical protein L195_g007208 [Trifolium pratense]|uniref:Uncharacterized protein n=1 Tax=Trifolium pratense TaxID=57577 RepID=A0A2K3P5R2_TRIPR|nr:hypothetical protein L195_g007208 [Trifolium pratense]
MGGSTSQWPENSRFSPVSLLPALLDQSVCKATMEIHVTRSLAMPPPATTSPQPMLTNPSCWCKEVGSREGEGTELTFCKECLIVDRVQIGFSDETC